VETDRGTRTVEAIDSNNFRISLGSPYDINKTNRIIEVADREYTRAVTINNKQYMITPLTVHQRGAVFFTSDDSLESLRQFSKNIIRSNDQTLHSLQPIFVQILSREDIIVHTWYRGYPKDYISTAAIGATAAIVNGFCDREVIIHNKHEHCYYQWEQTTNEILFTASPKYVFSCSYYYEEREI
jgi:diaminopimelate epimerase